MSCPAEIALSVYADGETEPEARRTLEAHLIGCEPCRARVLALRDEMAWLGDALHDREPQAVRLPPRRVPARGLALGAGPAVAAAALVATAIGWLLDTLQLPPGLSWLNPLPSEGLMDLAFDLLFALRDQAPALLGLVSALAAMLGASALLTFALTVALRRFVRPGAMLLMAALCLAPSASDAHFGLHSHEDFVLPAGEIHSGTLLVSGGSVDIDGVVDGDLVALAERLTVRGEVRGNVLTASRIAELTGTVQGSVFCLCRTARAPGSIEQDLYTFAEEVLLPAGGRVGRNLTAAADEAVLEGAVGRDLVLLDTDRAEVRGRIGRNIDGLSSAIRLREGARVGGDVVAAVHDEEDLQVDAGAVVAGETRTELKPLHHRSHLDAYREPGFYVFHVLSLAAAFLVGLVARALLPALFGHRLETSGAFFRALGLGLAALVVAPVAVLLAGLTLVGLPLALLGLALYLAALYLSGIVVAALVGTALVPEDSEGSRSFAWTLGAGVLVVGVVTHLPFVGLLLQPLVLLTGLGLLTRRAGRALASRTQRAVA
jgi:cytoskeletal protein CcmA (bactofilin family)